MEAFLELEELHATARHIELVSAKLEKLTRAHADSWSQVLTAAARMYNNEQLTEAHLVRFFDDMKANYGPGFTAVWNAHMPIPASRVPWCRRDVPNGPLGSWVGEIPVGEGPCPPAGVAVVYVLFDGANEPVYVGSTDDFRGRMGQHRKSKPEAVRWTAYRCRDREHAYEVEVQLLRQHMPRMNKRAGR